MSIWIMYYRRMMQTQFKLQRHKSPWNRKQTNVRSVTSILGTKLANWVSSFEISTSRNNFVSALIPLLQPYLILRALGFARGAKDTVTNVHQTRALACAGHFSLWIFSSIHCVDLESCTTLRLLRTLFSTVSQCMQIRVSFLILFLLSL